MANTKKILIYGGIAALLYFLFKGGKKIVDATSLDFIVKGINPSLTNPGVEIELINPSSQTYTVNSILLNVLLNDSRIGTVSNLNTFTIPANNKVGLRLNIDWDLIQAATAVYGLLYRTNSKNINITGNINTNGVLLPVSAKYDLQPNAIGV